MATQATTKEQADARRWKRELQLAHRREEDWLADSDKIVKRYRGEEKKRNRYNVLWANTEILRPAIYNSKPNPDVRRRFRDADPVGKAVSEVLERSLYVVVDGPETDASIRNDVLDSLLCGRGISRIRYIAKLTAAPSPHASDDADASDDEPDAAPSSEPQDETDEELEYEQAQIDHVDWRDFRHGYGRTWEEVPWVAFRHKLSRKDAEDKFDANDLKTVQFAVPEADDTKRTGEVMAETTKVAEFWEVWDKLGDRVFFTQETLEFLLFPKDNPDGEPPLAFTGFFPCPMPLYMIENTGSLLPTPPFHMYQEQAHELDKISMRIDKIINVCRLRGIYDAKLVEIPDLLAGDDNELTPIQNAQAWVDGGLDKAIAWMPVDKVQAVLAALYDARERQKRIIDDLTGISDIIRGATAPDETATAQQLKSNYSTLRLQRQRKEVERYVRDLLRLAGEVICTKFGSDTLSLMTDLKFPTAAQKMQLQMQMALAAQSQPPGAPPPPQAALLQVPAWEDILQVMRSPSMRQFRVDVETDSTVAGTLDSDMQGLAQVLKAVTEALTEMAPLVSAGALPAEAAKEITLAVIRRARLGMAVEDAFDKLQAPKPPPDPHQAEMMKAQAAGQTQLQIEHEKGQSAQALQAQREQAETQRLMLEEHFKTQREQFMEQQKASREAMEAKFDAFVRIITATITATKRADPVVQPVADRTVAGVQ